MSSAQLDIQPLDESIGETEAASAPFALKEQVAERLAAHRARRTRTSGSPVTPNAQPQSYRAFLAEEAERAIRQAEAAAEVAALNARAVAEAQNQLLFELDQIAAEASAPVSGPIPAAPLQTESFETPSAITITEAPAPASTPALTMTHSPET